MAVWEIKNSIAFTMPRVIVLLSVKVFRLEK